MLTDSEFDQLVTVLLEHERLVAWLYCDSKGYVTVGVGDKVGASSVLTMPFVHQSNVVHASADEKQAAYYRVRDFGKKHPKLTANAYSAVSDLRLPHDFCLRRLRYRVKSEFVPAVEKHCPEFAAFPTAAKLVLADIAYNVGTAGFARFTQLIDACNAFAFEAASFEVHTAKEGEDPKRPETWGRRNRWRKQTMLEAAKEAAK